MIAFIFFILIALSNVLINDYFVLLSYNLVLLVCYQFYIFIKEQTFFRLILVWNFAFIYLVFFEGFFAFDEIELTVGKENALIALAFLLNANWMVNGGYNLISKTPEKNTPSNEITTFKAGKFTYFLLIFLVVFFIVTNFAASLQTFTGGRHTVEYGGKTSISVVLDGLSRSAGFILPAIIAYYYKYILRSSRSLYYSLLLSTPIIVLLFMRGSRFAILFSLGGLFIVNFIEKKFSLKQIIYLAFFGVLSLYLATEMKRFRVFGIDSTKMVKVTIDEEKGIAEKYQAEGVVMSVAKMADYFSTNSFLLGKSSSTLLIFWIPRTVWSSKPTMLGHWFIREYKGGIVNLNKGHSISFTFAGDAFADFGPHFGALFCVVFGFLVAFIEKLNIKASLYEVGNINVVMVAMFYPFCFFGVRSINTAIFTLIGTYVIYLLFKKTLIKNESLQ